MVLEDGSSYFGKSFGASGESGGEVVFNTSMSGYQEILTDPSYRGQIVVMTYPQIGNYGVREGDSESCGTFAEGFVIKEYTPSVWPSGEGGLDWFLRKNGVVSIQCVDTRAVVRRLRAHGSMRGIISSVDLDPASLHEKVLRMEGIRDQSLVEGCSCRTPYPWNGSADKVGNGGIRVVVYDFGAKRGILNALSELGIAVTVVPHDTPPEMVLMMEPHGVLLSNGPGDPKMVGTAISGVKELLGRVPIFGICLGHQILCLAMGARIYKLGFGHHGGNHPVKDVRTGEVKITSQNHNYAADRASIERQGAEVTHVNLYDGTIEGMLHGKLNIFGIQYHPEACPGPNDSHYLFEKFLASMRENAET